MSRISPPSTPGSHTRISRNLRSTWAITLGGLLFFEIVFVMLWVTPDSSSELNLPRLVVSALAGCMWMVSTMVLLERYRSTFIETRWSESWIMARGALAVCLLVSVAVGAWAWHTTGLLIVSFFPLAQSLVILRWGQGIRGKVTLLVTCVLLGLFLIDRNHGSHIDAGSEAGSMFLLIAYSIVIPAFSVLSLWWWDVVIELDNARKAASELAATQERLRLANDLHDLQGHHLQVVALQLELAERLIQQDITAGVEQLQQARGTVATAQTETRELAHAMRPVVLESELKNAATLIRATGVAVTLTIDSHVSEAPSNVLAPIVRETTTNVLRHGSGGSVSIELQRAAGDWVYQMTNGIAQSSTAPKTIDTHETAGSGLHSMRLRAHDAGGTLNVEANEHQFTVTVRIPAPQEVL